MRRSALIILTRASSESDEKALGPKLATNSTTLTQMPDGNMAHSFEITEGMLAESGIIYTLCCY